MEDKWDLVIIGAGPGGYEAAIEAAMAGMKTALIEKELLGGTCLNRGCIPTKTILHTAQLCREVKNAAGIGIRVGKLYLDEDALYRHREDVITKLRNGIAQLLKQNRVTVFWGRGTILEKGLVRLSSAEGEQLLKTRNILIATGSKPLVPPVSGTLLPGVMTSDGFLGLEKFPSSLTIIGGGVIGMEFAEACTSLDIPVTVIEAAENILPGFDRDIAQNLRMILKKRGAAFFTKAMVDEITQDGDGRLCCRFTEKGQQREVFSDAVLIATGRKACTGGLVCSGSSPELAGIIDERGFIRTDENGLTCVPGIYAAGDVTGKVMLAHAAIAQGRNAVAHMTEKAERIRDDLIPSCVYTDPEIACVGLTPDQAKNDGIASVTKKYLMGNNGRSVLSGQERGFIKITAEESSGRILGAQMMCARATDMISQFTETIAERMTMDDLSRIVFPHPTFSEGIAEAAKMH